MRSVSLFRFGLFSIVAVGLGLMTLTVHFVSTQKAHATEISGLKGSVHNLDDIGAKKAVPSLWI